MSDGAGDGGSFPGERALLAALDGLVDPFSGAPLAGSGRIDSLSVSSGAVRLALRSNREEAAALEPVRAEAERRLLALDGVARATVVLTAHRPAATPGRPVPPPGPRGAGQPSNQPGAQPGTQPMTQPGARPPMPGVPPARSGHAPLPIGSGQPLAGRLLEHVRAVIAVASGKGGVGKSTTAVNLAVALAGLGLRTGLLDADIHGPSLPRMLGVEGRPEVIEGKLQPVAAWGLRAMSIGFLVEERTAMIWRGPMVMGALNQLMGDVAWGPLDVMVVDMPPGTGDAQLTLSQKVALKGAVIVSTPQDIALLDARRGVAMFEKVGVPVLGIVENMSYFCCPNCGHRADLFGHGGARREAESLRVPFLGEIPLLLDIRESADAGTPIVHAQPEGEAAAAYRQLAHQVARSLHLA